MPSAHKDASEWNKLVDNFDVKGLAEQLASTGAGYYLITMGQNSGYYTSPNSTYDRLVGIKPSKCSRRDLIADLYEALHPKGIRLMVYLPAGAPGRDAVAVKALEWTRGPTPIASSKPSGNRSSGNGPSVGARRFRAGGWTAAIGRMRCTVRAEPPNFATLAAAVRAGNPGSIIAFNNGVIYSVISLSEHEDYTAGEANEPERINFGGSRFANGRVDGAYPHMLSYLGESWGKGSPRFPTTRSSAGRGS